MTVLANSKSLLLSPDRNPVLRYLLKKTFYVHFCAGETQNEIQRTLKSLKDIGFNGVILVYAKEISLKKGHLLSECKGVDHADVKGEVQAWKDGNMRTVGFTESGDFVGVK